MESKVIELEEGQKYLGENGIKYLVLQSKGNIALLKSDEYVIANGTKINRETAEVFWNYGSYYDDLLSATLKFNDIALSEQEKIQSLMNGLNEVDNYTLFSSVLEHIQNKDKDIITENDLTKLKILYEFEAEEDIKSLISDNIKDMEHELNFDNIKKEIINYLKEMDIDLNKIPEKKIEEMAEDVLEFSINNDDTPYNLIWAVDYFREDVDKLRENKKDEENKSYLPYIIEKNKDISLVKYLSKETLYSVEIQNKDIGMSIYMGTDFRRAKEVYDKEKLFMDIQKTSNNILITTNVEVYGERLNKAIIGTDYLLGRKSSLIEYLQNELSNADKDFYEYNDNEKEDFKQKTEKILNELKQEKISLEPMYLYVNPINRSYEIANSEQTINKLKELSSKINEYINESEESEEDEL
ncbi:MAG TPA: hypothetical protein IAD45_01605 [Candidatus Faecimonas intestinavium]|nr:hypothetical protein [Candidatus Faecimonas intestinavium]